jgi:hypothetical protein
MLVQSAPAIAQAPRGDSTPYDKAREQLTIARGQVKEMLSKGYMPKAEYSAAVKASFSAVKLLSPFTNVSEPLYSPMTNAVRDSLKAIGQLETGWAATKFIDNGIAQDLQLKSLASAQRFLASAYKNAMAGTHP